MLACVCTPSACPPSHCLPLAAMPHNQVMATAANTPSSSGPTLWRAAECRSARLQPWPPTRPAEARRRMQLAPSEWAQKMPMVYDWQSPTFVDLALFLFSFQTVSLPFRALLCCSQLCRRCAALVSSVFKRFSLVIYILIGFFCLNEDAMYYSGQPLDDQRVRYAQEASGADRGREVAGLCWQAGGQVNSFAQPAQATYCTGPAGRKHLLLACASTNELKRAAELPVAARMQTLQPHSTRHSWVQGWR